ncbi:hypothetical protein X777_10714 [Ooceraea biroi]|uniref:Uncharacterized protein n=1 Tax=Ooceraea biroi TaxID=2015173 RepID=A0A026W4J8_OOCBI|nr:hypothetical protein X777_10714 [Ooceraea biroi]
MLFASSGAFRALIKRIKARNPRRDHNRELLEDTESAFYANPCKLVVRAAASRLSGICGLSESHGKFRDTPANA